MQLRIKNISAAQSTLQPLINRQQDNIAKTAQLRKKAIDLRIDISQKIREKVTLFVHNERRILNQHLLNSRRRLASVLEQMAISDKNQNSGAFKATPDTSFTLGDDG